MQNHPVMMLASDGVMITLVWTYGHWQIYDPCTIEPSFDTFLLPGQIIRFRLKMHETADFDFRIKTTGPPKIS